MAKTQNRRTFLATAGITVASVVTSRLVGQADGPKDPASTQGVRRTLTEWPQTIRC